jgi:hypothetical protein
MKTFAVRCDVPGCDSKREEADVKEHWASGWVSVHITSGQCAVVLCDVCPRHRDQVLELLGSFCEASFKSLCLPMPKKIGSTKILAFEPCPHCQDPIPSGQVCKCQHDD